MGKINYYFMKLAKKKLNRLNILLMVNELQTLQNFLEKQLEFIGVRKQILLPFVLFLLSNTSQ